MKTLDMAVPGQTVVVDKLTCEGAERRRLMDLGILPGTEITVEMRSPLNDPTAYLVRGALIALRREQAQDIYIVMPQQEGETL